jgi:hypothetical protein
MTINNNSINDISININIEMNLDIDININNINNNNSNNLMSQFFKKHNTECSMDDMQNV